MKHIFLSITLILTPLAVSAQSQLERFEEMASQMSLMMGEMMANEIDAQGGDGDIIRTAIPEPGWGTEMRAAAECMLEIYNSESSTTGVNDMLTVMEDIIPTMADLTISQFGETMDAEMMLPAGISSERSMDISRECGIIELQMKAMSDTGFMEAMMAASATIPDSE